MVKRLLLLGMAMTLATACQSPILGVGGEMSGRPPDRILDRGTLSLRVLWPDTASRHVLRVPVAAKTAVFTVTEVSGEIVATRTIAREEGASVSVSIDVLPGDDYSVAVELVDANGELLAHGKSAPFQIQRQRVSTVELTLDPLISRYAGTGAFGYDGNGEKAAEALLSGPIDVAADRGGNVYIAEFAGHVVRKVDTQGTISTVIGTNKATSGLLTRGDNGPATEATLNRPSGLAIAANGDLFVADSFNRALRLLPATSGERYGMTVTAGRLHTVHVDTSHSDRVPHSVAVDAAGNVFFAELARIRMLSPLGGVSTVAGTGASGTENEGNGPALSIPLNLPDALLVDPSGNLLFTERNSPRVRMLCRTAGTYFGIPMASGSVYAIAGKGVIPTSSVSFRNDMDGLDATFDTPRGLALDTRGNLYVSENINPRIFRLTPERRISVIAGSGTASALGAKDVGDGGASLLATFRNPVGLAVVGEMLYVADSNNHRIRRIPL